VSEPVPDARGAAADEMVTQAAEVAIEASQLAAEMAEATAGQTASTDLGAANSHGATCGTTSATIMGVAEAPTPAPATPDRGQRTVGLEDRSGLAQADLASAPTKSNVHATETAPISAVDRFWADLSTASTGRAKQRRRVSREEHLR
jgi:hypothetical protein